MRLGARKNMSSYTVHCLKRCSITSTKFPVLVLLTIVSSPQVNPNDYHLEGEVQPARLYDSMHNTHNFWEGGGGEVRVSGSCEEHLRAIMYSLWYLAVGADQRS